MVCRASDSVSSFLIFSLTPSQIPGKWTNLLTPSNLDGGILIFTEADPDTGDPVRRISVKFALNPEQEFRLQQEKNFLEGFATAEHFQQRIHIPDSRINFGPFNSRSMIATEYLHRGSLAHLRERCRKAQRPIPNRVLWYIFRCCKYDNASSRKGIKSPLSP